MHYRIPPPEQLFMGKKGPSRLTSHSSAANRHSETAWLAVMELTVRRKETKKSFPQWPTWRLAKDLDRSLCINETKSLLFLRHCLVLRNWVPHWGFSEYRLPSPGCNTPAPFIPANKGLRESWSRLSILSPPWCLPASDRDLMSAHLSPHDEVKCHGCLLNMPGFLLFSFCLLFPFPLLMGHCTDFSVRPGQSSLLRGAVLWHFESCH